jgi:hypothetical protein
MRSLFLASTTWLDSVCYLAKEIIVYSSYYPEEEKQKLYKISIDTL